MKKYTHLLLVLLVLTALLYADTLFARGGGGGGTGGGGKGPFSLIAFIIWGIYTIIVSVVLFFKKMDARSVSASNTDKMWDITLLENTTEQFFYKFQDAWMKRDLNPIRDMMTSNFYDSYQWQLDGMKTRGEVNMMEDISLSSVNIISCKDYIDNKKDSFTAYIKGSIVDYTINETTNEVIKNSGKESEKFVDAYVFLRAGNKWLADKVFNEPSLGVIFDAASFKEE